MTGLPGEGAIHVRLTVTDDRIAAVAVDNRRLLTAAGGLAGRPAEEAVGLVARLFSICRIAQGVAAAEAVEQAQGLSVEPAQRAARHQLILGEMVQEHASRALLDWAQLAGEAPAVEPLKRLRRALGDFHRAFYPDGDWMCPGGGRLAVDRAALAARLAEVEDSLRRALFGGDPPLDEAAWTAWLEDGATAPARLARSLIAQGLAGLGASAVGPLPPFDLAELERRLEGDDGRFIARPDWRGRAHMTGPLARRGGHPLVAAVTARHGGGVAAQWAARMVELALALWDMQHFSLASGDDNLSQPDGPKGRGLAVVEAARGRLVHRVVLDGGTVMRYQILAPTEWNFHPDGPLVRGLAGQPAGADAVGRARLAVIALDPCVAYTVGVR